jgi:hypothetical protein
MEKIPRWCFCTTLHHTDGAPGHSTTRQTTTAYLHLIANHIPEPVPLKQRTWTTKKYSYISEEKVNTVYVYTACMCGYIYIYVCVCVCLNHTSYTHPHTRTRVRAHTHQIHTPALSNGLSFLQQIYWIFHHPKRHKKHQNRCPHTNS